MSIFNYPAIYYKEKESGKFIVEFPDINEAYSFGDTKDEMILNATEVLELSLEGRIEDNEDIPNPSKEKDLNMLKYNKMCVEPNIIQVEVEID